MSRTKAESWLETRQQELVDLQGRQTAAVDELAGLEAKRAHAVKMLATGDLHQQKLVDDLEPKITALKTTLEGLASLITDTEQAISEARDVLAGIKQREQTEFLEWSAAKKREMADKMAERAQARDVRITEILIEVGELLADYQLDVWKKELLSREGVCIPDKTIEKALEALPGKVSAVVNERGYRPLMAQFAALSPRPIVKLDPDISGVLGQGKGAVNGRDLAGMILVQEQGELYKKFQEEKGNER